MKKWYKSKTNRIAILQFVIGVVVLLGDTVPNWAGYTMLIKSLLDVFLRSITNEAIV